MDASARDVAGLVDRYIEIGGGGRHADGSEDVISAEVLQVLSDVVAADPTHLARAALGTGADVRFVGGGMEQSPAEGVGALLRYAG
jgi:hypothetical protein